MPVRSHDYFHVAGEAFQKLEAEFPGAASAWLAAVTILSVAAQLAGQAGAVHCDWRTAARVVLVAIALAEQFPADCDFHPTAFGSPATAVETPGHASNSVVEFGKEFRFELERTAWNAKSATLAFPCSVGRNDCFDCRVRDFPVAFDFAEWSLDWK
jgi:hypothetical protein